MAIIWCNMNFRVIGMRQKAILLTLLLIHYSVCNQVPFSQMISYAPFLSINMIAVHLRLESE